MYYNHTFVPVSLLISTSQPRRSRAGKHVLYTYISTTAMQDLSATACSHMVTVLNC